MNIEATTTESGANRFSRHVAWTLGARTASVLSSFITGLIVARSIGAQGLGVYSVLMWTANSIVQIIGAGLTTANIFFAARESEVAPRIVANSTAFAAIGGLLGGVAAFLVFIVRPDWFPGVSPWLLFFSLAALPFQIWTLFGLGLFLAFGEVKRANVLEASGQLLVLLNALTVLLVVRGGLDNLVVFNAIMVGVISFAIWVSVRRSVGDRIAKPRFYTDRILLGRMMRFGFKTNVMNAALALILRADLLLVNYFRGETEAGVYSVATQFSLLVMMFPNVVGTMLFPNVASMKDDPSEFTARIVRHALAVLILICVTAVPVSFLLPVIYGQEFSGACPQLLVLLPGALFIGLQMMLSQHLVGTGKIAPLPFFWVFTLLLSFGLNLLLIPRYGALGAAMVSTISYAVIFVLTLIYFCRHTHIGVLELLMLRPDDVGAVLSRLHGR